MADTAARVGPGLLSNSAATKLTVAAVTTFNMLTIHVANTSGTAATFTLSIGSDSTATELFTAVSVPANGALSWTGFIPVFTAEIIQAFSGTNNVLNLTIGGVNVT